MTRAAVIGLGRIASTWDEERRKYDGWHLPHAHIGCMVAVPEIEIVGLSDTWAEQREAARAKWGIDALFEDYREMLAKTRPQIVSVCTSMNPRTDIMLEIANGDYGVQAIWAEKPLTYSLAQADATKPWPLTMTSPVTGISSATTACAACFAECTPAGWNSPTTLPAPRA